MARPRKALKKFNPALHSEMPTKERGQHDTVIIEHVEQESRDTRTRAKVLSSCRIDEMYHRKQLTSAQYLTACDVKQLAFIALSQPTLVASYSDMIGQGSIEDGIIAKSDAWGQYKALEGIIGHTKWRVVRRVVVDDEPAGSRIRMKHLRDGLDELDGKVRV